MPRALRGGGDLPIGRVLQLAFLVLVVLPLLVVTGTAYLQSRQALHAEIHHLLQQDADMLAQSVDGFLYERLENLLGWRGLDVMQDARVGDVDKRITQFLRQLAASYGGIYRELDLVAPDGRVLASSTASRIGGHDPLSAAGPGRVTRLHGVAVTVHPPQALTDADGNMGRALPLTVTVPSRYGEQSLGTLQAWVDWRELHRLLVRAVGGPRHDHARLALLLDRRGGLLGAARIGASDAAVARLAAWLRDALRAPDGDGLAAAARRHGMLVGHAVSPGFLGFRGLGWQVVVAEPEAVAFAPVQRLLHWLLAALLLTSLAALGLAAVLARHLAAPLDRLAAFSRHYNDERPPVPPPPRGPREVRELTRAMSDMTRRLRDSRQQLVRASKLAAVGEMAAHLAHEVRTPLGILRSSAQILRQERALSPEGREMVAFIDGESERLNRLVTLLLESGRPREPVFGPVEVGPLVATCVDLLRGKAEQRGLTLRQQVGRDLPSLWGDAGQLQQVLLNLLLNAIQITPAGGEVAVRAERRGDEVRLAVHDSGPGVAPAERSRIFEPFVSGREGGFGLGLSVVQQILGRHGVRIVVDDSPLGGAAFTLHFPIRRPQP